MGWLTTTPITSIERGDYKHTPESLRQGVRNLITKFGDHRPLVINLGNEPHGTGERVRRNVQAYQAVYEAVKEVDDSIPVVATSVEPNEEYFSLGYGKWCDAYDFHIYEHADSVRKTMQAYRALMKKYDVAKPIWSTELGLNSQGQPRHRVAVELIRKFATFFAAGGANVSWFGLLYPDPDGKQFGSSGDTHNVFDCRYNRYCPRLDAIAYYHMVNAIAIKRFAAERAYSDGTKAFLFRDKDDRCLVVLWNDEMRRDVFVPLADVSQVRLSHVDGATETLEADGEGVITSLSKDPILLQFQSATFRLPETIEQSTTRFGPLPDYIVRHQPNEIQVVTDESSTHEIRLVVPPFWAATKKDSTWQVTLPRTTSAREGEFAVTVLNKGNRPCGRLYVRLLVQR